MPKETATQTLPKGFKLQSKDRSYEIIKVLGSGSFGITYLASAKVSIGNISTTIKFAIKEHFMSASCYRGEDGAMVLTVPTAKSDVIGSKADFITEANRLKKLCLKSRSIVSVNETFEANGTAYYVMEFLDGGSPSKCTEEDAVSIVMQIADALKEIHKEYVLHLDLKPDNIVLKTNDKNETYPVLIDFGISKHFDSKGRPTSSLSAKGASPGYAPQEQYAGITEFSPKYDIYALGAVLFYLCTGKNPPDAFKISPNQQELRKELTGKVSPNIEKAILNAMKPSSMERTPSIKQFCDDLMGIDFVPVLNVSPSVLNFDKEKSERTISVDSNIGWTVFADKDWCKVSKANNNIVISVSRNKESGSRTCDVIINGASYQISQVIQIKQEGTGTVVFPIGSTWWERNCKKVYVTLGVVFAGFLMAGLNILFKPNSESDSQRLTEAIESGDINSLKKFADLDSIRAFKPLIRNLRKQSDLEMAKMYANQYAKLDSTEYLIPMAEIYFKEKDYHNAKLYVDKYLEIKPNDESIRALQKDLENFLQKGNQQKEVIEIPETPSDSETKIESNDEKFARAYNDFNLMLSLAKDNYTKAYYPLAEMYFNKGDIKNAKLWCQRSIARNINRSKAESLLKKITSSSSESSTTVQSENSNVKDTEKRLSEALKDPLRGASSLTLLAEHEHYVPAYYHYAKLLLQQGKTTKAKEYLKLSIEKSINVSQSKELLDALEE